MKIEAEKPLLDETELHAQKQIEKKTVLIGSAKLTPGHRVFQINEKTLDCEEAKYNKEVHYTSADRRSIIVKPDCVYVMALNKKNALKRFKRANQPK